MLRTLIHRWSDTDGHLEEAEDPLVFAIHFLTC